MPHETILESLAAAARSSEGLTFLDAQERESFHSFSEIFARAKTVAVALAELGVEAGDRVVLVLPTGLDFMDAFFGALAAGAVPVPLYPPVRLGRLDEYHARTASLILRAQARVVLTDARVGKLLGVAVSRARPKLGLHHVSTLYARGRGELLRHRRPEDLALVQFSSGTTVDPKPVGLSHRNVLANAASIDTFLPEGGAVKQRGASWLPLYHDMGLIGCLLLAVRHPGPLTLIPPELFLARPALWLRAIARHRATVSPAPNFAYGLCLKRVRDQDLEGCDLSSWTRALNGAEPVSAEIARAFCQRFSRWGFDARSLMPVYGLSEASLAVTFTPLARGLRTLAVEADALSLRGEVKMPAESSAVREVVALGPPVPGMEVRIAGASGETLGVDQVGAVKVRGPSVMQGYLGDLPATERALEGGWLDTGDLGFVHDGELFLCGRKKDLVIVRGKNHAPQEFEEALEGLPGVRAGCVAAVGFVPQKGEGEELLLFVEKDTDKSAPAIPEETLAEAIRARVVERTGVRPYGVELLDPGTLPRTSSGKLRRSESLRLFYAGELLPPARVTTLGVLKEVARSTAALTAMRVRNALTSEAGD
ncbi:MAG: fatty acyl-AMP ligase [Deltaproteobacteria bacterium]|nr:fatty acyl-AMP ligase [Deltaproteobacteria bacterium]